MALTIKAKLFVHLFTDKLFWKSKCYVLQVMLYKGDEISLIFSVGLANTYIKVPIYGPNEVVDRKAKLITERTERK